MKIGFDKNMKISLKIRVILIVIDYSVFMFAVLFLSAWRWDYWNGWLYLLFSVYQYLFTFVFIPSELIQERITFRIAGTKKWDKIITYALFLPLMYIIPLIAALDGGRYHRTGNFPIWVNALAFVMIFLGYSLFIFSMWKNQFFSAMVHIQKDRGHYVIDQGPYSFIRHPGYSGYILSYLAAGFALNSLWALIPAGLLAIVLIIRTYLEDITLQKELPGYKEYTARVRYRLVPGIW